jgi:hypothetical protein
MNGKAVWKGQLGTIITPSTVSKFDFFDDGSAVALYQFDGNALDTGGNFNGVWIGNERYNIGKFGRAAMFDGSSEVVLAPQLSNETITISMWLKNLQNDPNSTQGLFTTGDAERDKTFRINFYHGRVDFQYGGSGTVVYSENTQDWINKLIHLAVIINGDFIRIYKNGSLVFSGNGYGKTLDHKNKLHIGFSQWYFIGIIDQVRIFNRALTNSEIQTLYNEVG